MEKDKDLTDLIVPGDDEEITINDMKAVVTSVVEKLSNIAREVKEQGNSIKTIKALQAKTTRTVKDIEEEYPLLPPEADDLSNAVRRKGVAVMGGKKSNAYANRELRTQIYRDIYTEIKRNYGLIDDMGRQKSYKKLKRKHLQGALSVVDDYELPIALQNEVDAENEIDMEDWED